MTAQKIIEDENNRLLREKFSGPDAVAAEIINLEAILRLPKGTEHFLSDLHGEYAACCHLLNNCSGVVRNKIDLVFGKLLSEGERGELATTIYYPERKIEEQKRGGADMDSWYKTVLYRMTLVARETAKKYTRSKVRKCMPKWFDYILDEMLNAGSDADKAGYYDEIFDEIIALGRADGFVSALAHLIKRLAVDHLHVVGDIFDRGEHPEKILDLLTRHGSIDVQWGNHDILWMGAALGSAVCIATVIELCLKYANLELLEIGYGISLRELAFYADRLPYDEKFAPKCEGKKIAESDRIIAAKMRKANFLILLKLEGQAVARHPEYGMENRALLRLIDAQSGTVLLDGERVPVIDAADFAGLDPEDPCRLTGDEARVKDFLIKSFTESEKLNRHLDFLMRRGGLYTVMNGNLIFHGCVPLTETGDFLTVSVGGVPASGRALMDAFDRAVRSAAYGGRDADKDIFWYLWCGSASPLFGRKKLAAFESVYVADSKYHTEEKNAYYTLGRQRECAERILAEFGLRGEHCHIINGHIPVESKRGESPVKADGKLIVIDGGFCQAYQSRTGIAGYTLIYNSYGMRLAAHSPFLGVEEALRSNADIVSDTSVFETTESRLRVADTDVGVQIRGRIAALKALLERMRAGFEA